jgi:hypothetical protein
MADGNSGSKNKEHNQPVGARDNEPAIQVIRCAEMIATDGVDEILLVCGKAG